MKASETTCFALQGYMTRNLRLLRRIDPTTLGLLGTSSKESAGSTVWAERVAHHRGEVRTATEAKGLGGSMMVRFSGERMKMLVERAERDGTDVEKLIVDLVEEQFRPRR